MIDPMLDVKDRLILAALPDIPFDGWSMKALSDAAESLGLDRSMAERAFPGGPVAAVLHFADLADRRLAEQAEAADLSSLSLSGRVKFLVRRRIEEWAEHREAVRRAVSLFSLPQNAVKATQSTWRSADLIWYLAGDGSVDFSYYTKRASLAALYSATLLVWLSDQSEDCQASWEFLDRRVADLGQIPKTIKAVQHRAELFLKPVELILATARKQGARARHFGLRRS